MTKKSFSVVKKMKKLIYNSTFVYPLVIKDGQGFYIENIDGEQYHILMDLKYGKYSYEKHNIIIQIIVLLVIKKCFD